MVTRRSVVLWTLVVIQLAAMLASITPVSAATSTEQQLKPSRESGGEYYYYDGDVIYGVGGKYTEPVKFVKKYGDKIYIPDGDTMGVAEIKKDADQCESEAVPTKLWKKDPVEGEEPEPAFFLNVVLDGSAELDLTKDQEDGVFRWGKVADHVVKKVADKVGDAEAPKDISPGTMAKDLTKIDIPRGQDVHIQNSDVACYYMYFKYFNRLVAPYDDDTLEPGPLNGRILGRQGVIFDDYVTKADNRLRYRAYTQSARQQILEHCNRQTNLYKCINLANDQHTKCYAQSIDAASADLEKEASNVMSDVWETEFKPDDYVECFAEQSELYADPDKFFADKKALEEFAQTIIDEANLPPSLKPADPDEINPEVNDETQCSLGMLGWILCPVFSFIATINDQVFDILKNWLVLAPFQQGVGGSNAAAYDTWSKLRNIVNSLFVLFFIIVVYSQVTGRGLNTYGIRALLPRIIVGAILVNLSYFICSVAVDLSNSLGDSIYKLLNETSIGGATIEGAGSFENITATLTLAGGAAAGTIALLANLSALVPVLVMAFVALVTTFLVLLLRQALIIVLVAMSSLAFLLYVLPSTASWFAKWRKMFISLLMIYPMFALVFSGSQIAAEIVRDTAAYNDDTLLTIFSLGITVIPLFLLPLLMKLGGGVLNRFGGIINNPDKGPFDRMRKRADEFRKDRKTQQQTRALNGRAGVLGYGNLIRMSQRNKAKQQYHAQNARRAAGSHAARNQDAVLRSALGSRAGEDLKNQLKDVLRDDIDKELREEYEAAMVAIENSEQNLSGEDLQNMAMGTGDHAHIDEGEQAAAMQKVIENGDVGGIDEMLDHLHQSQGQLTDLQREVITKAAGGVSGGAAHLSAANVEQTLAAGVPPGQTLSQALYANAAARGAYSPATLASQDGDSLKGIHDAHAAGAISDQQLATIKGNFAAALNDTKQNNRMTTRTREAGRTYLS